MEEEIPDDAAEVRIWWDGHHEGLTTLAAAYERHVAEFNEPATIFGQGLRDLTVKLVASIRSFDHSWGYLPPEKRERAKKAIAHLLSVHRPVAAEARQDRVDLIVDAARAFVPLLPHVCGNSPHYAHALDAARVLREAVEGVDPGPDLIPGQRDPGCSMAGRRDPLAGAYGVDGHCPVRDAPCPRSCVLKSLERAYLPRAESPSLPVVAIRRWAADLRRIEPECSWCGEKAEHDSSCPVWKLLEMCEREEARARGDE